MARPYRPRGAVAEPCSAFDACDRPARAKGLCDTHYRQARAYGRVFRIQQRHLSLLPKVEGA